MLCGNDNIIILRGERMTMKSVMIYQKGKMLRITPQNHLIKLI